MIECPCSSGKEYQECCEPLISGERKAVTAEELLRARYSAHVK
ncbi:SEC-C domain-containing protein, partial [bacterium]|nr:SEC-C domain-containing protein [bacterium]